MNLGAQQGLATKQFGPVPTLAAGEFSELLVTELAARFKQQTVRGNMFSMGMQITSIANATFTTADGLSATLSTAATATPIVGLWNPAGSGVNAVICQAHVPLTITALQVTPPGPLIWAVYTGQAANITTATKTAVNRKTFLSPGGAQCQNVSGLALTGLQNTGSFLAASALPTYALDASTLQTAAGLMPALAPSFENIDGSIVVQPGQIVALYASVTPVAISAASSLLWYEEAITV